jgi:hypothetical protein
VNPEERDREDAAAAMARLHGVGWSLGVAAFRAADGSGRLVWEVDGRDGENVIRAGGATEGEAWRRAAEQARSLGMRGR